MLTPRIVRREGGRALAYAEWGDPAGFPVFALHGTPGCRLNRMAEDPRLPDTGARLITYDRPGYGASDRHPGRTIVDCVPDAAAIADDLGIEHFAVVGGSGGGPHALALAARLPGRVLRASCVSGVAPFDAEGLDFLAGTDPLNVREHEWSLAGEPVLLTELEREAAEMQARVAEDPTKLLGDDWSLSDSDRAVLTSPENVRWVAAATQEMFARGVWGWVDDDLAFVKPWGFDVSEIVVPVEIRYGEQDVLVPPGHGAWLAEHVPGASVLVDSASGHMDSNETALARLADLVALARA